MNTAARYYEAAPDADADVVHPHTGLLVAALTARQVTLTEALAANPFVPMMDDRGRALL